MRNVLLPKQTGLLTIALLIACPLLNSSTDAMSVQQVSVKAQPVSTNQGKRQAAQSKTVVLARNTTKEAIAKADNTDTAPAMKPERVDDKKTVGRCWKRLMNNIREIRHAQKKN